MRGAYSGLVKGTRSAGDEQHRLQPPHSRLGQAGIHLAGERSPIPAANDRFRP